MRRLGETYSEKMERADLYGLATPLYAITFTFHCRKKENQVAVAAAVEEERLRLFAWLRWTIEMDH